MLSPGTVNELNAFYFSFFLHSVVGNFLLCFGNYKARDENNTKVYGVFMLRRGMRLLCVDPMCSKPLILSRIRDAAPSPAHILKPFYRNFCYPAHKSRSSWRVKKETAGRHGKKSRQLQGFGNLYVLQFYLVLRFQKTQVNKLPKSSLSASGLEQWVGGYEWTSRALKMKPIKCQSVDHSTSACFTSRLPPSANSLISSS